MAGWEGELVRNINGYLVFDIAVLIGRKQVGWNLRAFRNNPG